MIIKTNNEVEIFFELLIKFGTFFASCIYITDILSEHFTFKLQVRLEQEKESISIDFYLDFLAL